jgi:hypothetical protein
VEYGSVGEEEGTRGRGEETAGRKVGSGKVEWKQYKEKDTREKRETRLEAEREVAKCKGHGTHPKWKHPHVAQEEDRVWGVGMFPAEILSSGSIVQEGRMYCDRINIGTPGSRIIT